MPFRGHRNGRTNQRRPNPLSSVVRIHGDVQQEGVRTSISCDIDETNQSSIVERGDVTKATLENRRKAPPYVFRPRTREQTVQLGIGEWRIDSK